MGEGGGGGRKDGTGCSTLGSCSEAGVHLTGEGRAGEGRVCRAGGGRGKAGAAKGSREHYAHRAPYPKRLPPCPCPLHLPAPVVQPVEMVVRYDDACFPANQTQVLAGSGNDARQQYLWQVSWLCVGECGGVRCAGVWGKACEQVWATNWCAAKRAWCTTYCINCIPGCNHAADCA